MPDLAVVIPAYITSDTQWNWLNDAARSVMGQSFTNWELITVDDGSPFTVDGPTEGQIRIIHHDKRRGAGAGRNTGIAAASAPYVLCLDADDELRPGALEKLWSARCEQGIVYGDLEYAGDKSGYLQLPEWSLELLLRMTSPLPVTSLHPKALWREVGGFDEHLVGLEDVDYWIRLAERGYCGARIPETTLTYRRHSGSRQAGLETDDRRRLKEVREYLTGRHRRLIANMAQAKCKTCPGSGAQGTGINPMTDGLGPNTTMLRYVGPLQGGFTVHGMETGLKYYVDGRGATILVDSRDVAGLLSRYNSGRPDFEQPPVAEPTYAPPAMVATPMDNPPSDVAVITSLNAKDAISLVKATQDLPDLTVWLAEERAAGTPRQTVVAALEAQIANVAAGVQDQDG
jgi:hypothetical protein